MSKGFASNFRIGLCAFAVLGGFGVLAARLVDLHVTDRGRFLAAVEKARQEIVPEYACRGQILDRNGRILATSLPVVDVGFDPTRLRARDRAKWPELARLLGRPFSEVSEELTAKPGAGVDPSGDAARPGLVFNLGGARAEAAAAGEKPAHPVEWVVLAKKVPMSVYAAVRQLGIDGVYGNTEYERDYPHGEMAAHLLGFVNDQQQPVAGLERYLDFYLRGEDGWVETEKDGLSRELPQFTSREVRPSDGYDVVLTIDSVVQNIAQEELAKIAGQYRPEKATVIVSDPRTGAILALANYPSFDPNQYNRLTRQEQSWMNDVAVDSEYDPGSVFKIVAVSGAIDAGLVTPDTAFDCTLRSVMYEGTVRNLPAEDAGDHFSRHVPVRQIIARSSNKGTVQTAMLLGDQRFYHYLRAFGFGQRTGFPIGGEIAGSLSSPAAWQRDATAITHIPIGQGVSVTALQMHQAMGVIASGGLLMRPQLVREIRLPSGATVFRYAPIVVRRVISERTAAIMAGLLWGVTNSGDGKVLGGDAGGTAPKACIPGYDVAGKTATAQKIDPLTHRYSTHHHVASFVGFLPAGDPQVEISVVIDDADARCPGGVAYGGSVAAPAFRDIAVKLISYLPISPARRPAPGATLAALGP